MYALQSFIIYVLFTSVEGKKTTFFAFSLLPDTPKITLIIFSVCIILYNLARVFTFIILFEYHKLS